MPFLDRFKDVLGGSRNVDSPTTADVMGSEDMSLAMLLETDAVRVVKAIGGGPENKPLVAKALTFFEEQFEKVRRRPTSHAIVQARMHQKPEGHLNFCVMLSQLDEIARGVHSNRYEGLDPEAERSMLLSQLLPMVPGDSWFRPEIHAIADGEWP